MERPRSPHEAADRILLYTLAFIGLAQGVGRYVIKPFIEDFAGNFTFTQEDLDQHIKDTQL